MAFDIALAELVRTLDILSRHIRAFAAGKPSVGAATQFSLPDECLLEGFLSRAWQGWSNFCRRCVIGSCVGTTTSGGRTIVGLSQATSEAEVSGAAIRASRKISTSYWGVSNAILRLEPTWGDADVSTRVLTRLNPSNGRQLLAAFSSGYASAKAIQRIRNGAAHNNAQSVAEIQGMRSAYVVFPISHPTHAMFWIEPRSGDFLITHAIDELKDAGLAATS